MDRIFLVIKNIIFSFTPLLTVSLLYMWQSTEYRFKEVIDWQLRSVDYKNIQKRKRLVWTSKIMLLAAVNWIIYIGIVLLVIFTVLELGLVGLWFIILLPIVQWLGIVLTQCFGKFLIQNRTESKLIEASKKQLKSHQALRIAVAGSYGKTTVKEILLTILEEKMHVAASPGNMNTPIGIARFVQKLDSTEDVLIFEYGEEKPGDVAHLASITMPDVGVITGISAAHMTSFKTMDRVADTIFELKGSPGVTRMYGNIESDMVKERLGSGDLGYSQAGCDGWVVSDVHASLEGLSFTVTKDKKIISLQTTLIGSHLVGPIVCAVAIADHLGLSIGEIEHAATQLRAFEHRMQPKNIHGALVIDDTYNGNPAGVAAGLRLLKDSKARRRVYVTPGLVEQGKDSPQVHRSIGIQIADSADVAVLMRNSVTADISSGLKAANFKGQLIEIDDPMEFYANLDSFVAAGDVLLMQNDWPDNYA